MKTLSFQALKPVDRNLIQAARAAARNAYCPYSGFAVGAALRTADGRIVIGANVENAAYGSTLCAERSALASAYSQGCRVFRTLAVVAGKGGVPAAPCGACRQMLFEASESAGKDIRILLAAPRARRAHVTSIRELLPRGFGPLNLVGKRRGSAIRR